MSYIGIMPQNIVMTEGGDTPLVVDQCLHTAGVAGSRPAAPTKNLKDYEALISDALSVRTVRSGTSYQKDKYKKRTSAYVVASDYGTKVGVSSTPEVRLSMMQTGCPVPLSLFFVLPTRSVEHARACEQYAHAALRPLHIHREWFNVEPEDAALVLVDAFGETLDAR